MFKYILSKEIRSELYTWKSTLWLLISSLIFSFTSYLLLTNKELSLLDQTEMLWLFSKIIIGVGLLIVIIDASSIITNEFEKETAESLFLAPLSIKDFVTGKFLASLALWLAVFVVAVPYMIVTSAGSHLVMPFIGYIFLLGTICVAGFIMMIFGFSFLFRSSKNVLTTSLIIALALTIPATFTSTLKNNPLSGFLGTINPVDNVFASLDNVLVDYQTALIQNWRYILPIIIFSLLALIFMFYSIRRFYSGGIIKSD
jgi:ABC-type transport system involved in multi-copper enzyme maturation permease subunit